MFPDASLLFPSRTWNNKQQKEIQKVTNILRIFQNIYVMAIPNFEELDISFRRHFHEAKIRLVHDRRILEVKYNEERFFILIPNLNKEYIAKIDILDRQQKKLSLQ